MRLKTKLVASLKDSGWKQLFVNFVCLSSDIWNLFLQYNLRTIVFLGLVHKCLMS
jgi:hypothetical protein